MFCDKILLSEERCIAETWNRVGKYLNPIQNNKSVTVPSSLNDTINIKAIFALFLTGLDGSTSGTERERLINEFNHPDNKTAWVFLLSTRLECHFVELHKILKTTSHQLIHLFSSSTVSFNDFCLH